MKQRLDPETRRRRNIRAVLALAIVIGPFFYAFRLVRVQGHSMDPTFHNGQWLLVRRNNWPSPPLRVGDVVVFRMDRDILVKRIAALGGQPALEIRTVMLIRPSHTRPGDWEAAEVPVAP